MRNTLLTILAALTFAGASQAKPVFVQNNTGVYAINENKEMDFFECDSGYNYNVLSPVLSPDQERLAFVHSDRNRFDSNNPIYIVDVDWENSEVTEYNGFEYNTIPCSNRRTIEGDIDFRNLDWGPEGNSLVVDGIDQNRNRNLYLVDVVSGRVNPLLTGENVDSDPSWGANNRIYFKTNRFSGQLGILDLDTGKVTAAVGERGIICESPDCCENGIVFSAEGDIYQMGYTKGPVKLTEGDEKWNPQWGDDGFHIFYEGKYYDNVDEVFVVTSRSAPLRVTPFWDIE